MSASGSLVPLGTGTELDTNVAYTPWHHADEPRPERNGLVAVLRRHRLKILGALILGALLGYLLAYLTPPTYRAEAVLEFKQGSAPVKSGASGAGAQETALSDDFVQTQLGIIRSHSLAEQVAEKLPLNDQRFAAALAPATPGSTKAAPVPRSEVVERMRSSVGAGVDEQSRLARVSFDSRDPAVSAIIANAYVDNYIQANLQRQYDTTVTARRFLEERLGQAKDRLERSEKALIEYTRAAGLIDPTAGTASVTGSSAPRSLASDDLAQLNQAYAQARAERIAAEQRWQEAQRTPLMSLPEVLSNPTIQQLTQKTAEAQAAYQQQRQQRLDTHPAMVAAAAQIAESNRQIHSLAQSVQRSIRDRYQVARRQEADLARNVERLKTQTLNDQGKGVQYNVLKRNADSNRQLYETLFRQFNDLSTAAGLVATDAAVVDRATPPKKPISPNPVLWSAIGAAIALLLTLAWALVSMFRDDYVHSPESIDANLHLRVLGVLPRVRNPVQALADPASPLSEAHYSLRASLELVSPGSGSQTILFTSSKMGEGKSTAAFGVARDFASSGQPTLLIDADMRKPTLQDYVDADSPLGLSTVLADLCTAEAATLHTPIPNLSVMLAGPMPASPAALLSSNAFKGLLKHLSRRFKVIIIDGPPVLGLADSPRLAAAARQTVFIVESERASVTDVRAALQRLVEAGAKVVGAVLTKFDLARSGSRANLYVYNYPRQQGRPQLEVA